MNKSPQDPDEFKFAEKFPVQMQKWISYYVMATRDRVGQQ
jgi:hypothetical protein